MSAHRGKLYVRSHPIACDSVSVVSGYMVLDGKEIGTRWPQGVCKDSYIRVLEGVHTRCGYNEIGMVILYRGYL